MDNASWAAAVVSGFTFLGVLVQMWKAARQRKWDVKDRETARKALEDKLEADRYNNLVTILNQFQLVMGKLVEGLAAAKVAYKEANDVNLKMARLREDLNTALTQAPKVVVAPVVVPQHPPRSTDPPAETVVQSPKEVV